MRRTTGYLALLALGASGCRIGGDAASSPQSPRDAMETFARCTFDDPPRELTQSGLEGAIRVGLHAGVEHFAARAGRCEDALRVGNDTPPCLAHVRSMWTAMLPLIESPTPDAIAVEQAIRHVGNAWTEARAGCR